MAIDPISLTMMISSVGLNFITNSKNSKKQAEKQAAQKEFQRAQAEHDFQRMREAQERAIQLNKEIEAELHAQRLEEIESNYDGIIDQIAKEKVINNWPITLLPFVMKGQRFGSFIGSGIQSIAMHCILTPSNNKWFNDNLYKGLDFQVQAYINEKWHSHSSHPVFYHGGGWKNTQEIDLNQIDQLRSCLKAVPTMVITPYFDVETTKLYFRIELWGMGENHSTKLYPQTNNITTRIFSYDYCDGLMPPQNADINDFIDTTYEEFVPYIVSLIAIVADKYYWSFYNIQPILPEYSSSFQLKTLREYVTSSYIEQLETICHSNDTVSTIDKAITLFKGTTPLLNKSEIVRYTDRFDQMLLNKHPEVYSISQIIELETAILELEKNGVKCSQELHKKVSQAHNIENEEYELKYCEVSSIVDILENMEVKLKDTDLGECFLYEIWNDTTIIGEIVHRDLTPVVYCRPNNSRIFIFYSDIDNIESSGNRNLYLYDYLQKTNKRIMKKNSYEETLAQGFERAGRELGRFLDRAKGNNQPRMKKEAQNTSIWDDAMPNETKTDPTQKIIQYFIDNAGTIIPAIKEDTVKLESVLNWVDNNPNPFATKVYIIKSFVAEHKRMILCVFYGNDDSIMISEKDVKACFISSTIEPNFEASFKGNDICVIPLKD